MRTNEGKTVRARPDGFLTCRDLGLRIGTLEQGPVNAITDVEGVRVGHVTLTDPARPELQTGVTAVLPRGGDIYANPVVAAAHEINGYSKSLGLTQVKELGQLESPIVLTNTFSVGAGFDGVLAYLMNIHPSLRSGPRSANPVVAECNDSLLSDMQARDVTAGHVLQALTDAAPGPVRQGPIGAGRGMSLFGLKGGIGSASRTVTLDRATFTVGGIVLGNFGELRQLTVAGAPVGRLLDAELPDHLTADLGGSVIVVLGTDAPASDRQLLRIIRRAQNGLARAGGVTDHGSGELVIGFSTARRALGDHGTASVTASALAETSDVMNPFFAAAADVTEEATLNALFNGHTVIGRDGHRREGFPVRRLYELVTKARTE
jgi:D-aminopeptidase